MGSYRQEYWSGLPFPPPGDLSHPGIKPEFLIFPALAGGFFTLVLPRKPSLLLIDIIFFFAVIINEMIRIIVHIYATINLG